MNLYLHNAQILHAPAYAAGLRGLRGLRGSSNLALGKSASQSSSFPDEPQSTGAGRAVDGNRSGDFGNRSLSHTGYDKEAWWQIDLGAVYDLDQVDIYNRTDCCSGRLKNFFVLVSDVPFNSLDLSVVSQQAGIGKYYVGGPVGAMVSVPVNRTGRFVRIQLRDTEYLALAEIEIYGNPIPQSSAGASSATTTTGSDTSSGQSSSSSAGAGASSGSSSSSGGLFDSLSSFFAGSQQTGGGVGAGVTPNQSTVGFFQRRFNLFGFAVPYYVPLIGLGAYLALSKKHR